MLHHGAGYTRLSSIGVFGRVGNKVIQYGYDQLLYVARSVSFHLVLLFFFSRAQLFEMSTVVMVGCFFPANGVVLCLLVS